MRNRKAPVVLMLLIAAAAILILPWQAQANPHPTLYWGSRGQYVRIVQRKLQTWGYYKGRIDGAYGSITQAAVTSFQRKNGLAVDGVVGPKTWRALGESVADTGGGSRTISRQDDLDLLARAVSSESQGEPYEGQVAVAAVILNRIRDARFPNTLAGVIYQTHAFESVSRGSIYWQPTNSSRRAARDALNGWDPSAGAVFFWNPNKPVSKWIWSRPIIKRIGNHVFAT